MRPLSSWHGELLDDEIGTLADTVSSIKRVRAETCSLMMSGQGTEGISIEIGASDALLTDIGGGVESADNHLRANMARIGHLLVNSSNGHKATLALFVVVTLSALWLLT